MKPLNRLRQNLTLLITSSRVSLKSNLIKTHSWGRLGRSMKYNVLSLLFIPIFKTRLQIRLIDGFCVDK